MNITYNKIAYLFHQRDTIVIDVVYITYQERPFRLAFYLLEKISEATKTPTYVIKQELGKCENELRLTSLSIIFTVWVKQLAKRI